MIGDTFVVDGIVHPYDLSPDNQDPASGDILEAVYAAHKLAADPEHEAFLLAHDEFFSDFSWEACGVASFVESQVDFAVMHALPNLGFARSHVTDPARAAACRDAHPDRFALYATVDTPVLAHSIAQLEQQVSDFGVDGLKLYPAFFYDGIGEGWRLDGEDFATPLIDRAHQLGIRHVAVHKALWLPPAPKEAFRIDDLAAPLQRWPEMTFQIVHAGTAFLDQTCELLAAHPNLYLTLETTFQYILTKPDLFARILGRLIEAGGSERLLFASGNNLMHPQPLLDAFAGYDLPEIDRRNILGLNALRMYGLDADALRTAHADDTFARARAEGVPEPWSVLRAQPVT